jgi:hypothetical protein
MTVQELVELLDDFADGVPVKIRFVGDGRLYEISNTNVGPGGECIVEVSA